MGINKQRVFFFQKWKCPNFSKEKKPNERWECNLFLHQIKLLINWRLTEDFSENLASGFFIKRYFLFLIYLFIFGGGELENKYPIFRRSGKSVLWNKIYYWVHLPLTDKSSHGYRKMSFTVRSKAPNIKRRYFPRWDCQPGHRFREHRDWGYHLLVCYTPYSTYSIYVLSSRFRVLFNSLLATRRSHEIERCNADEWRIRLRLPATALYSPLLFPFSHRTSIFPSCPRYIPSSLLRYVALWGYLFNRTISSRSWWGR